MRSIDPCPQCGGAEPHKGRKPDCGTAEPEPPNGGEAYTVCYVPFEIPKYVLHDIDKRLRKALFVLEQYEDGTFKLVSGAVTGNRTEAWRTGKRVDEIFESVKWDKDRTLFITLTHPYIKTEQGRKESWEFYQKELPRYIRKLKAKGMKDFIIVKEAHRDGGCHAHIMCQWDFRFRIFTHKGKRRIANRAISDFIKDNWAGDIDIVVMTDDNLKGYVKKHLGKYSHVEDALRRAKGNWTKEGEKKNKDTDVKKLWTNYYCCKLKIRRFTCNIANCKETPTEEVSDMIKNMNNATAERKPQIVRRIKLPMQIKNNPSFEPYSGKIDPNSRLNTLMINYITGLDGEPKKEPQQST